MCRLDHAVTTSDPGTSAEALSDAGAAAVCPRQALTLMIIQTAYPSRVARTGTAMACPRPSRLVAVWGPDEPDLDMPTPEELLERRDRLPAAYPAPRRPA
jgi:hypothetical protein